MFVKIKNWDPKNLKSEVVYHCKKVALQQVTPSSPEDDVTEMALILDVGEQDERTVIISCNRDDDISQEIYYMNDDGKTIDKYIY